MNKRLKKPKGDTYYGKIASDYEVKRTQQDWWWVEQKEMEALLDKLPEKLSVLDVPFGTGRFVEYYLARKYKVFGLDASNEMMETAEKILGKSYKKCKTARGFSVDLPYDDKQFDLVSSTRFLSDIIVFGDAKRTLSEFARVCKRYAIVELGLKKEAPFEEVADDERLGSRMSREQTYELMEDYGFRVMETRMVKEDAGTEMHLMLFERV